MAEEETEVRKVEVTDESLSPRAREALTHELQEAVGSDEVEVPKDTPRVEGDVRDHVHRAGPFFGRDRLLLAITLCGALTTGGVVSIAVDQWWILLVAVGIHAIGTLAVGATVIQMTTQPDAPDPTVTALLEEEGVHAPETTFNALLEEYSGAEAARGTSEVVASKGNERNATAGEDKASAHAEQESAMTPTHGESEAVGSGSAVVQYAVAGVIALFSIAVLFVNVERGWIAPLVLLPVCAGWVGFHVLMGRRRTGETPHTGDDATERRRMLRIAAGCWVAIEAVVLAVVVLATVTA